MSNEKWCSSRAKAAVREADSREEAGDVQGAIQVYSLAILEEPDNPVLLASRGRLYYLEESWRLAIDDFSAALKIKGDAPTTLYFRGKARAMNDDLDGAVVDLQRVISLQPEASDAYSELAYIYQYRRDLRSAVSALEHALRFRPDVVSYAERLNELREELAGEHGPA